MTKFLFDLDGTITKQETLPLIAKAFGVEAIEGLTKETIAGNVPFVESFIRRVHLLKDLPVDEVSCLLGTVEIYPLLATFIRAHKEACGIVTGNLSCWIGLLVQKLGCACYASEAVVENQRIQKLSAILRKENVVQQLKEEGHRVIFIGDGNNDVEAMRIADRSIAAALTHSPAAGVLSVADYLVLNEVALCRQLHQLL
ncbi:MAG: HAD family phosphatase [Selenomonadaceae bacterium]|nr:HAD family phosphatase [Selenomonadaceae bacterium]MBR4694904.1 HAD family phosphatase [Selenomonadaceae bacterium]